MLGIFSLAGGSFEFDKVLMLGILSSHSKTSGVEPGQPIQLPFRSIRLKLFLLSPIYVFERVAGSKITTK